MEMDQKAINNEMIKKMEQNPEKTIWDLFAKKETSLSAVSRYYWVIDLGSSNIKIAFFDSEGVLVAKELFRVRLANKIQMLDTQKVQEIIEQLRKWILPLQSTGLPASRLEIIATEAIRDAKNQNEFLENYQKLNFIYPIRVLPHLEEATLEALGALKVHPEIDQAIVVGLGGQSMQMSYVANRTEFLKYKKLTDAYLFPRFGVKFLLGADEDFKKNFGLWKSRVVDTLDKHPEFKKLIKKPGQQNKTLLFAGGAFWKSMFLLQEGVPGSTLGIISEEQINFFSQLMNTDQFEELEKSLNPMLDRLAGFQKVKIETFLIAFIVLKSLYEKLKPQKMIVTEEAVREGMVAEMINAQSGH